MVSTVSMVQTTCRGLFINIILNIILVNYLHIFRGGKIGESLNLQTNNSQQIIIYFIPVEMLKTSMTLNNTK